MSLYRQKTWLRESEHGRDSKLKQVRKCDVWLFRFVLTSGLQRTSVQILFG